MESLHHFVTLLVYYYSNCFTGWLTLCSSFSLWGNLLPVRLCLLELLAMGRIIVGGGVRGASKFPIDPERLVRRDGRSDGDGKAGSRRQGATGGEEGEREETGAGQDAKRILEQLLLGLTS
ncbi:hypothetical protein R1sor_000835 [Riccia sorocarpa]|uniref:Uncharacterized protein n=1 Tax=Riccia sorocarpa TaxID=122646 RepID=A0ABD3GUJ8_9MARC